MRHFFAVILLISLFHSSSAQVFENSYLDSLKLQLPRADDYEKARLCNDISLALSFQLPTVALTYTSEAMSLAEKSGNYEQLVRAYNYTGVIYLLLFNYPEAISYFQLAVPLAEKYDVPVELSYAHNNIGEIYCYRQEYDKAKEELDKALECALKTDNPEVLAWVYEKLSMYYTVTGEYDRALESIDKGLAIGPIQSNFYFRRSLVYQALGDTRKVKENLVKSSIEGYDLRKVQIYSMYADCFLKEGDIDCAKVYVDSCFTANLPMCNGYTIRLIGDMKVDIYNRLGQYDSAAYYSRKMKLLTDSLYDITLERSKKAIYYSTQYIRSDAELQREYQTQEFMSNFLMTSGVAFLLFCALLFFLFRILRRERNNKLLLKTQNEEIKSSIEYARLIQSAIMPPVSEYGTSFADKFVLYKPCDIISGDFYWHYDNDDYEILVVADSSGHGVPAALMSMLGMSALQETAECDAPQSAMLMETLRNKIKIVLHQNETNRNHFDDIKLGLMIVDKKTRMLDFCGAMLELYLIHQGTMNCIKCNGCPAGVYSNETQFVSEQVQLEPGDCIYMSTAGYITQVAQTDEMSTSSQFAQILLDLYSKPMAEQKNSLEELLNKWNGISPIDVDILVAGFRV